jgi:pyruvate dehydrogenase E2 component (dihydrolipoamide acetyltransferase)
MAAAAERFREFRMPDVGEGLTEAEILKWLVQPGDAVTDGQVVVEVETAKAAVELPIPYDGQVRELLFPEGTTVDVGTPIITVDTAPGTPEEPAAPATGDAGANAGADAGAAAKREPVLVGYGVSAGASRRRPRRRPEAEGTAANGAAPQAPAVPAAPEVPAVPAPANGDANGTAVLAKPPVRKLAKDLKVDLRTVRPTGPNGTITRDDVHAAAGTPQPAARPEPEPGAQPQPAPAAVVPGERRIPIRGVRKATAQAMVASAFTAPHATEWVTVDVTRTVRLVERLREDPDMAGRRVTPLLIVAKALLTAVRRNPDVNAFWDEDNQEIVYKDHVNLGIAAATPRGLLVPNVKRADTLTLPALADAITELVARAREGRTAPGEMQGGTMTITNIGVFGIDSGTPILNPGESAILALGAIREQPWVHKGKIKPRHVTTLALSFDHRLIDGELGSRLLADVAQILEQPKRLLTRA